MILVDSSVWIDHFRSTDPTLVQLLNHGEVLAHPFVIGELALGNLRQRDRIIEDLGDLPLAVLANFGEVLTFINRHTLFGRGVGYIAAHLLASVRLMPGTELWTRDRRLYEVASSLGMAGLS